MVLDDFRFKRRMPSRAAAIRGLLKRGLAGEGFQAAAFGAKPEEFGVIGRKPDGREKSSGLSLSRLCRTSGTVPGPIHLPQENSFSSVVESEQKSVCDMPYRVNADLPPRVRKHLLSRGVQSCLRGTCRRI